VNGVELCAQTFGEERAGALLLIAGASNSMDWWEEELCNRLAAGPLFVVRYDLRDTGQSVADPPGSPSYSGSDLIADAVGLLDALALPRAHVLGISMGGGIAQRLALEHADRVLTLTLLSTSPGGRDLPPPSAELAAYFADRPAEPDWADRSAVIDYIVEDVRAYARSVPFDDESVREVAGRVVDRTRNIRSTLTNHGLLEGGDPIRERLGEIAAPTLVLHGTEDPLFPYPHAEALAAEIPGARLIPLAGVGHELPPRPAWDRFVTAVLEHTARRGPDS
jgi:pimeloyl-ACP methyl ester carboxylesterase